MEQKIAVKCSTIEQNMEVIKYARKGKNLYIPDSIKECINLYGGKDCMEGCHESENYYIKEGFTIITYDDFVRKYLSNNLEIEKWYKSSWVENAYFKFPGWAKEEISTLYTDFIFHENFHKGQLHHPDWWKSPIPLEDLSEIQDFLPEGHVDKFKKEKLKSLVRRWVKCLERNANSCIFDGNSVKEGNYYQLGGITEDGKEYKLRGGNYCGFVDWEEDNEKWKTIGFELMPPEFSPNKLKDDKEWIPVVGDWVMIHESQGDLHPNFLGEGGKITHKGPFIIECISVCNLVTKISGIEVNLGPHRFRKCLPHEIPKPLIEKNVESTNIYENWCVKNTPDIKSYIIEWGKRNNKNYRGDATFYGKKENELNSGRSEWGNLLTKEEFLNKIGISDNGKEKKLQTGENNVGCGEIDLGKYNVCNSTIGDRANSSLFGAQSSVDSYNLYMYSDSDDPGLKISTIYQPGPERGDIKIQAEVSTLHIPSNSSVTLKNTENEVKINVKQLNSIKIN